MKSIFLTLLSLGLLTACSASRSAYTLGGEWDVVNLNGTAITPDTTNTPWLGFNLNEGQIYGYTGCNQLNGGLDAKALFDGKASFDRNRGRKAHFFYLRRNDALTPYLYI